MTIGIYALYWEEQDLVYVGQSVNIEKRYKEHINSLRKEKHFNYKVQDTYQLYGIPSLVILTICTIDLLDTNELFWVNEFDTLNIAPAGSIVSSAYSRHSVYTKIQILLVFRALSNSLRKQIDISTSTGVGISTITAIATGTKRVWLKEKYPVHYQKMLDKAADRKKLSSSGLRSCKYSGKEEVKLLNPLGELVIVSHLMDFINKSDFFCNKKSAYSGLHAVLSGVRLQFMGWTKPQ